MIILLKQRGQLGTRSGPPGDGVLLPSAASNLAPDSANTKTANGSERFSGTAQLHHPLNLAEPHGLEQLQPLADHA